MQKFISSCVSALLFLSHPLTSFAQFDDLALVNNTRQSSDLKYGEQVVPISVAGHLTTVSNTVQNGEPESDCTPIPAEAKDFLVMQNVIIDFFSAMKKGDVKGLQAACTKNAIFKTHLQDQYGNHHLMDETVTSLIPFVVQAGNCFNLEMQFELLPPDISSMQFRTPYVCLVNNAVSHCGVCTFEFAISDNGWKIKQMVDTRSRSCN